MRPLLTLTLIIAGWSTAAACNWINPLFLPTPISVLTAGVHMLQEQATYRDILATSIRALLGLLFSAIVAIPLGLVFGRNPLIYEFFELPADFLRSIPSSALFFLFILVFGIGEASKIAVVFYGCSLILLVNTVYGSRPNAEKVSRINMLRSFGATPLQLFRLVIFPDALPHITAGVRICVSMAFVLVIVTEMFLGAADGIGRRIYDYYLAFNIPYMYASIILLGMIGFTANRLSLYGESKACFWITFNQ